MGAQIETFRNEVEPERAALAPLRRLSDIVDLVRAIDRAEGLALDFNSKAGSFRGGAFGVRGSAAQKLAVDSLKNIADASAAPESPDAEVDRIAKVLRSGPTTISNVAEQLTWDTDRVANALARGGDQGVLRFFDQDGTTVVALS